MAREYSPSWDLVLSNDDDEDLALAMDHDWDLDATEASTRENDWTKISTEFTNVGYREGITAGKESALQEGFNSGFALVGAPIGHELGLLRGISSGLVSYLTSLARPQEQLEEARDIASKLADVRLSDLAPRDLEAEEHAKQHLEDDDNSLEPTDTSRMEQLEDMLANLNSNSTVGRPTAADVESLRERLEALCEKNDLKVIW